MKATVLDKITLVVTKNLIWVKLFNRCLKEKSFSKARGSVCRIRLQNSN